MNSQAEKQASFTFFRSYYEAANELSEQQRLVLYDAIMQTMFEGDAPELSGIVKAMFTLIRPVLNKSAARAKAAAKPKADEGEGEAASIAAKAVAQSASAERAEAQAKPGKCAAEIVSANDAIENPASPVLLCTDNPSKAKSNAKQKGNKTQAKANQNVTEEEEEEEEDMDVEYSPPSPRGGVRAGEVQHFDDLENECVRENTMNFDRFWLAYPKKQGKQTAQRVWARLKPSQELAGRMLAAIETAKQSEQWQREGGRYVPAPATWLSAARWEDEPLPQAAPSPHEKYAQGQYNASAQGKYYGATQGKNYNAQGRYNTTQGKFNAATHGYSQRKYTDADLAHLLIDLTEDIPYTTL